MEQIQNKNFLSRFGFILGGSLIVAVAIGAFTFYKIRSFDDTISVTGSAKIQVTSDKIKWTSTITRGAKIATLKQGYEQMNKDVADVKAFFASQGIAEGSYTITPVFMEQNYEYNQGNRAPEDKEYTLRQNIELQSDDVKKITELAKNTQTLIQKGVIFSTNSLEYSYSKLPEARVNLLADAIKDAKARAQKLAESNGQSVGSLKSAASGVVQVLPFNSNDVSDYGSYDTQSVEKDIMVTVKASFTVR